MLKKLYILSFLAVLSLGCSEDTVDVDRQGRLTGTITEKGTNLPLENVKVTTNPASTTVRTDADGNFVIPEILVDDYSVQAELQDFRTAFQAVEILENLTSTVEIEMEATSDTPEPPTVPELVSPADGAEDVPLNVDFVWNPSTSTATDLTYTLELRNGATNEFTSYEIENDTMFSVENLQIATNFFWQVKVNDGENDPVASEVSSFTTISLPNNPFLFVKEEGDNSVIYSGDRDDEVGSDPDVNLIRLTDPGANSFRPKKNIETNKIAFLRTVNSETHLFTMNFDGTDVFQVTRNVFINGFRLSETSYTWANNGGNLYFPNLDVLYSIDPDGGNVSAVYQTTDGSLISEIQVPDFDQDLLLLKTNDLNGYNVRIFTYRLSTQTEETVILEGERGAAGSIDITANATKVIYSRDLSESQNANYRQFESRLFMYDVGAGTTDMLETDVVSGELDEQCRFSPSEGAIIWTRRLSNSGATPGIFTQVLSENTLDAFLFTEASMPDWE